MYWTWLLLAALTQVGAPAEPTFENSFIDREPAKFVERRENLSRLLASVIIEDELEDQFVIEWVGVDKPRRWPAGSTLRVAFFGGDPVLWASVESAALPWFEDADISASFTDDDGHYRTWKPKSDQDDWTADIRISFSEDGYWSLLGNESVNPAMVGPGEASMSLGGFDEGLPRNWQAVVLHEFGHALGFDHEHQHNGSTCERDMKWQADPGYQETWADPQEKEFLWEDSAGRSPGVLRHYSSPPHNWSREEIRDNLFQFPVSRRYELGPYDPESIMKYNFPSFLFREPDNAPCNTREATTLSDGDKNAVIALYGRRGAGDERADELDLTGVHLERLSTEAQRPLEQLLENLIAARDRGESPP